MNTIKYIGIDVHQATSVFAIRDHQGKLVGEAVLETRPAAIIDFLKGQRGTVWVTFEEGTYANWLYDVIHPHVAKLLVCDPRKNKLDGNKTDKIDARRLAELLRLNALQAVYHGQDSNPGVKGTCRQLCEPAARQHARYESIESHFPRPRDSVSRHIDL